MKLTLQEHWNKGMAYSDYYDLVADLANNFSNTGEWSELKSNFTRLNFKRMKRINAKATIPETEQLLFQSIPELQHWMVLTESWCADAAQSLPIINKIASCSDNIQLKVLLRDENPELMDQFLTGGSRSIPKLIIINSAFEILTHWGPRPKAASKIIEDYLLNNKEIDDSVKTEIQLWYNSDQGKEIIQELVAIEMPFIRELKY